MRTPWSSSLLSRKMALSHFSTRPLTLGPASPRNEGSPDFKCNDIGPVVRIGVAHPNLVQYLSASSRSLRLPV